MTRARSPQAWTFELGQTNEWQNISGDYEDEDRGIFWSNDREKTIGEMARSIGVLELEEEITRVRRFHRTAEKRL